MNINVNTVLARLVDGARKWLNILFIEDSVKVFGFDWKLFSYFFKYWLHLLYGNNKIVFKNYYKLTKNCFQKIINYFWPENG